jgi:hypothetical protein
MPVVARIFVRENEDHPNPNERISLATVVATAAGLEFDGDLSTRHGSEMRCVVRLEIYADGDGESSAEPTLAFDCCQIAQHTDSSSTVVLANKSLALDLIVSCFVTGEWRDERLPPFEENLYPRARTTVARIRKDERPAAELAKWKWKDLGGGRYGLGNDFVDDTPDADTKGISRDKMSMVWKGLGLHEQSLPSLFSIRLLTRPTGARHFHLQFVCRIGKWIKKPDSDLARQIDHLSVSTQCGSTEIGVYGSPNSRPLELLQIQPIQRTRRLQVIDVKPGIVDWILEVNGIAGQPFDASEPRAAGAVRLLQLLATEPYCAALRSVSGDQPIAFIPDGVGADHWWALGVVARVRNSWCIPFGPDETALKLEGRELLYLDPMRKMGAEADWKPRPDAKLPACLATSGEQLKVTAPVSAQKRTGRLDLDAAGVDISFETFFVTPPADAPSTRIGSLDLHWKSSMLAGGNDANRLIVERLAGRLGDMTVPAAPVYLTLTLQLPLSLLAPGGSDPLPDEMRAGNNEVAPPITIPGPHLGTGVFKLTVREKTSLARSRSLTLNVHATDRPPQKVSPAVTVIDERPFLVAKLHMDAALGDRHADTELLAEWRDTDEGGRRWRIFGVSDGFWLQLPPQAVGEATERLARDEAILPGRTIDYRIGRGAAFRMFGSPMRRFMEEPPWNVRRVLGYPGQRSPGATLDHAHFELLYGLTTEIDAREQSQDIRFSELFARLGAAPTSPTAINVRTQPDRDVVEDYSKHWELIVESLRQRLAVFELYDAGSKRTRQAEDGTWAATGSFSTDRGLAFRLRTSADLYDKAGPPPAPGEYPALNPAGLKGGATWGFDSREEYRAVVQNPSSKRGVLERPHFSALGGWGTQRAYFNNGKTRIFSDTQMGRVSTYTVETIGRIRGWWNRAKYVRVYERTTLPSEQFRCAQKRHVGLPILRLVRVFVEIIEPIRSFPEWSPDKRTSGPMEALQFNTRVIAVDPEWMREFDGGFEIPLWNPQGDPEIYPRPDIRLAMSGDKQGIAESALGVFSRPFEFHFVARTAPELSDDTDSWPDEFDFDTCRSPTPAPEILHALGQGDDVDTTGRLLQASQRLAGYGRFTYTLDRAPTPTNLVAERQSSVVGARLDSITVSRGSAKVIDPASTPDAVSIAAAQSVAQFALSLDDLLDRLEKSTTQDANSALASAQQDINAVATVAKEHIGDWQAKTKGLANKLGNAKGKVCEALRAGAEKLADVVASEVTTEIDMAESTAVRVVTTWGAAATVPLEDARKEILESLDAVLEKPERLFRSGFDGLRGIRADLRQEIAAAEQTVIAELERKRAAIVAGGAQALESLQRLRSAVSRRISQVRARLPEKAPGRMAALLDGVRKRIDRAELELTAAFEAVQQALGTGNVGNLLDAASAKVTAIGTSVTSILDGPLLALDTSIEQWLDTTLVNWPVNAGQYTLREWRVAIHAVFEDALATAAAGPDVDIARLSTEIQTLFGSLRAGAMARAGELRTALLRFADAICGTPELMKLLDPLEGLVGELNQLAEFFEDANRLNQEFKGLIDRWKEQTSAGIGHWVSDAKRSLKDKFGSLDTLGGRACEALGHLGESPTFRDPDQTLRLLRAVGEGPIVPNIHFNRDRIAYFFDDAKEAIRTSPVAGLVNRLTADGKAVRAGLESLGLRIPTDAIGKDLLPPALSNFDLNEIFPSFASLKGLFQNVKFPKLSKDSDAIQITHGIDKVTQVMWLKALVDTPLTNNTTVFEKFGAKLVLARARMLGSADLKVGIDGALKKSTQADVVGNWQLLFSGQPIVRFVDTALHYGNDGKLRFDVRADRIQMDRALQWLSDLVKSFSSPEDGFTLQLLEGPDGMPGGIRASLNLPLPPIAGGAFAITNLQLGALLELLLEKVDGSTKFAIGVGANLGREDQPFTLTVSFLGGAGYLEAYGKYYPELNKTAARLRIGMDAAAGTAFAIGPVRGSVFVYFGIFASFSVGQLAEPNGLTIGIRILVYGQVTLFSYINVTLSLRLEAVYQPDQSLIGRGTISITVRLTPLCKLKVRQQVRYVMKKGKGGNRNAGALPVSAAAQLARQHVARFE